MASSPRCNAPGNQIDHGNRRNGEPDARHGRTESQVETDLDSTAARSAPCCECLRQEDEHRDDHTDDRHGKPGGHYGSLDGWRHQLRMANDGDQATNSNARLINAARVDGGVAW